MLDAATLHELGLSAADLGNDLQMCEMVARDYERQSINYGGEQRANNLAFAATYYRRAAAHALLVGDKEQQSILFERAARVYYQLQMPYFLMMLIFTERTVGEFMGGLADLYQPVEYSDYTIAYHMQRIYIELTRTHTDLGNWPLFPMHWDARSDDSLGSIEDYQAEPIGVLGIRLRYYINLIEALNRYQRNNSDKSYLLYDEQSEDDLLAWDMDDSTIGEALTPFLTGYDEALQIAMGKRPNWQALALPFHPAEPDILSVFLQVQAALNPQHRDKLIAWVDRQNNIYYRTRIILQSVLQDHGDNR